MNLNYLHKIIITLPRPVKQLFVLINDILLSLFSTFLAFSIRLDQIYFNFSDHIIIYFLSSFIFIPFFIVFGLYLAIFRFTGYKYLIHTFYACASYDFCFFILIIFTKFPDVPRSIGILQPLIFFILIIYTRIVVVQLIRYLSNRKQKKKLLVYGTSSPSFLFSENLIDYKIVGYIDQDKNKSGQNINNIKIYHDDDLELLIKSKKISDIIIFDSEIDLEKKRHLISKIEKYNISVRLIPDYDKIIGENITYQNFKRVGLEELIERNISWNREKNQNLINNNAVLITGAGGSIGSEVASQVVNMNPSKLIIIDHSEYNLYIINSKIKNIIKKNNLKTNLINILCSILDKETIKKVFKKHKPDFIFHAAAYKHVPLAESNIESVLNNNIYGTLNVVQESINNNCKKFILISTDKAVNPTSIMGASKRFSELIVQSFAESKNNQSVLSIVRFGNVLGSAGSVVPLFNDQIEKGGPITVTDPEVTRYFMSIPEAVGLVLESIRISKGGEVFILNMGKPIKILYLAKKMIRLSGMKEKINGSGDIEIKYIGLRKGEKLHEELIIGNSSKTTENPDILLAKEIFVEKEKLIKILDDLIIYIKKSDKDNIFKLLKNTIIGYN